MKWKDVKLGSKFTVAFGTVILLLATVAMWSIGGINGIVSDADEVISGNQLRTDLEVKYVQHLKWVLKLNDFISNEKVKELTIQTDYNKCDFGKWYYGDGRKEVERLAPSLKPILSQMEEPHQHLHGSAIEIHDVYQQANYALSINMHKKMEQHLLWSSKVKNALLQNSNKLNVETNHENCDFGKWLNSYQFDQLQKDNPEYSTLLKSIIKNHKELHKSAIQIDSYLSQNKTAQAEKYFAKNTNIYMNNILSEMTELIDLNNVKLKGRTKANEIYHNKTQIYLNQMGALFGEVIESSKNYLITDEQMLEGAQSTRSWVMIFSIIAIIVAIILAYIIAIGIIRPLKKGVNLASMISDGNLTVDLDINQKDEIGQLALALQNMKQKLKTIIGEIIEGTNQITTASQELSTSSTEQAASTEEVSSSMEEMIANIEQNTENAMQTEKIANKAATEINIGYESVTQTVRSMQDIAEKITIIEEIAEKTDLLAINAAIEAARAGEHGKGFAVVAMEVRKLAERSQEAAAEINKVSKSSVAIAEHTGKKMGEIVPEIKKTSTLVQEISASSNEQSTGAEQVNSALQLLNQTNQGTAANAEELATQAEMLKEAISFFNVNQEGKIATKNVLNTDSKIVSKKLNGGFNSNTTKEFKGISMESDFESY